MQKLPKDSELLREFIFDICWRVFSVPKNKLILPEQKHRGGGGRTKDMKSKEILTRYLYINWLNENQQLTRRETGDIFNIDHSTVSHAIKNANIFVQNRDIEFCGMMDKFNNALSKQNINIVRCDTQIKRGLKSRLTKEEKYNLKFMLENEISINKLAVHFHVSLHTIRKFKNELNDSK